jgi:hypothetical protein
VLLLSTSGAPRTAIGVRAGSASLTRAPTWSLITSSRSRAAAPSPGLCGCCAARATQHAEPDHDHSLVADPASRGDPQISLRPDSFCADRASRDPPREAIKLPGLSVFGRVSAFLGASAATPPRVAVCLPNSPGAGGVRRVGGSNCPSGISPGRSSKIKETGSWETSRPRGGWPRGRRPLHPKNAAPQVTAAHVNATTEVPARRRSSISLGGAKVVRAGASFPPAFGARPARAAAYTITGK